MCRNLLLTLCYTVAMLGAVRHDRSTTANDAKHLLCSRPRKILIVFQRIRFGFSGLRPRICLPLFASSRIAMSDRLPARTLLSTWPCSSRSQAVPRHKRRGTARTHRHSLSSKSRQHRTPERSNGGLRGKVLTARRLKDGTRIEILQLPLDR